VLLLLTGAAVAALWWANETHYALRCTDGKLEATQGSMLPVGESALGDPLFIALPVPDSLCQDTTYRSYAALESAYLDTAVASVDAAIAGGSGEDLQRGLATLELILSAAGDRVETDSLERRRRALLSARLRVEVDEARATRQRALTRIEQARKAGLDGAYLDELQRQVAEGTVTAEDPQVEAAPESPLSSTERAL
jgi:hypothetical protein